MTTRRQERVSELLQEELSILISTELTDPRLADAMVTVTHVDVSQDLRNARVYVEHALGPTASKQVLEALYHSESFLRKSVVATLNLRFVPHFTFTVDETNARARHIDALLDALEHKEKAAEDHESDAAA